MAKPMTKKGLKKKVWAVFSIYIRLRDCLKTTGSPDYGKCITCNNVYSFSNLQAGHFIPGRHPAYLFCEKGVNAQCARCNKWLEGNTLEYRRKIIEMYGEGADEVLEQQAKQTKKFTIEELQGLLREYREKIKELEVKP